MVYGTYSMIPEVGELFFRFRLTSGALARIIPRLQHTVFRNHQLVSFQLSTIPVK